MTKLRLRTMPIAASRSVATSLFAVALLLAHPVAAQTASMVGTRAAHAAARTPGPVAEATAARLEGGGDSARLTFDLSRPVDSTAFVLADPDRVIVDLPQIDFTMDPDVGKAVESGRRAKTPPGLVASYRFGLLSPGRSRIVLNLRGPARIVRAAIEINGDKARLVVDLAKCDRSSFRLAAQARATSAASQVADVVEAAPARKPVIVLDPGHGGPDTGAIVNGVVEKGVALDFAQALARKLEASGAFTVVMTRADDVFIPLSERVRVARAAGAALMISIHADTLGEAGDVSGATVYTVSDRASDAAAAKVAATENAADATVGADGQADAVDVSDILFDLTRQETRAYSHVFARTLVNYWKVAGRLNKNPQRAAGFRVLKAPDVPSVLLELGYLSNAGDAASLVSADWREAATSRMVQAVEAYFADRRGPQKAAAGIPIPDVLPQAARLITQASAAPSMAR